MNLLEIDAVAEGIFEYLRKETESPLDGVAVLGVALLKLFDRGTDGSIGIERFAEDFKRSMIESYTSTATKQ